MDNKTVQYKRTLRGSVGAGVNALFNGNGRRYYILEHKDASKFHKAGESQKIIIDQVELGRDGNCQVRFDESFATVSRRHAAIIREGDRWKLVQLSKTNSTFLNGRPVDTEWYLENGDEIQLSVGGPRMGFIVPIGKQSLVSSIRMTERLELFRKQALKPYKTAIASLAAIMVVGLVVAGGLIRSQGIQISELTSKAEIQKQLFEDAKMQWREDSLKIAKALSASPKIVYVDKDKVISDAINVVEPSVFAVITKTYFASETEMQVVSESQGSGFLLADGRFVTARHCVEPWMFNTGKLQEAFALSRASEGTLKMWAEILAVNNKGEQFRFKSSEFTVDRSYDVNYGIEYELNGQTYQLPGSLAFGTEASLGNDWAYIKTSKQGTIVDGKELSSSLAKGSTVHLLGFPMSLGILDGSTIVDPIYNSMSVSRTGLNNGRCIMVSQGIDHGNSGGPVFIMANGKMQVIGIVSRGDSESDLYNHLVPMSNLK